jgi:hypothetical protein
VPSPAAQTRCAAACHLCLFIGKGSRNHMASANPAENVCRSAGLGVQVGEGMLWATHTGLCRAVPCCAQCLTAVACCGTSQASSAQTLLAPSPAPTSLWQYNLSLHCAVPCHAMPCRAQAKSQQSPPLPAGPALLPCCGTMSMSPSALARHESSMHVVAVYMWMA